MKVAKLVIGILSMVLAVFVIFQSCAAGVGNALAENGEVGGTAGVFLAVCVLSAGIVGVATRKSEKKGGNIAVAVLYLVGAAIGAVGAGSYSDLKIWAIVCVIFAVVFLVDLFVNKRKPKTE